MSDKFPGGMITANAPAGFSVAFDGTGDYLTAPNNVALQLGSSSYTLEAWVYPTTTSGGYNIFFFGGSGSPNYVAGSSLYVDSSNVLVVAVSQNGSSWAINTSTTGTVTPNRWSHVALVRNGTTFTVYLNGTSVYSSTLSGALYAGTANLIGTNGLSNYLTGYVSNVRAVIGTALYTAAFTPPTQLFPVTNTQLLTCQSPTIIDNSTNNFTITANGNAVVSNFTPFAAYTGFNPALGAAAGGVWTLDEAAYYQNNRQWPIYDPYFNQTTLMLHGNGTNAAQNNTFLDSSTNNFTITRNGNTTQGTFTPFSQTGWSNYFPATAVLNNAASTSLALSTSSFTIEGWFYIVSGYTNQSLFRADNGGAVSGLMLYTSSTQLLLYASSNGSSWDIASGTVVGPAPINVWTHLAVARNGNTFTVYVNGVNSLTFTNSSGINQAANIFTIGGGTGGTIVEYISNFRVVIGSAVYTSNFTPSTQPLTAVTNTRLLTCQDNRFVDNSANNLALTATNSPSVQAFSPFVPAYITPTTYSNWFDGTGDYLSSSSANYVCAGDFTVEAWFYATSNPSFGGIISTRSSTAPDGFNINLDSAQKIRFFINNNDFPSGFVSYNLNQWYHVALVRSGSGSNNVTAYVNGISVGSVTNTSTTTTSSLVIGRFYTDLDNYYLNGVVSNVRLVNGTALYTANFTPPNAPFPTGTTNQQLLTCQASTLIDSNTYTTAKTITANGNVQPVTSPTPFPAKVDTTTLNSAYSTSLIGGSGYFDGTGDYLTAPSSANLDLSTGDFTFEVWLRPYSIFDSGGLGNGVISAGGKAIALDFRDNTAFFYDGAVIIRSAALKLYSWNHLALVRSSGVAKFFVNGVLGSTASYTSSLSFSSCFIGSQTSGGGWYQGEFSGMRLVKGTALYNYSFAPPIAPPTAVTNTQLLLNYTNAGIIDNTAKNVLETVGNAQISTTQSKWGGSSMYFDGTGDWLVSSNKPIFDLGSGDWTIEGWVYPAVTGDKAIFTINAIGTGYSQVNVSTSAGGAWYLLVSTTSGAWISSATGGSYSTNNWYHFAAVRNGTSVKLYINGTSVITQSVSGALYAYNGSLYIGQDGSGAAHFNGYIDDLRVTKGYARYTTNFTPPTSQLQDQ